MQRNNGQRKVSRSKVKGERYKTPSAGFNNRNAEPPTSDPANQGQCGLPNGQPVSTIFNRSQRSIYPSQNSSILSPSIKSTRFSLDNPSKAPLPTISPPQIPHPVDVPGQNVVGPGVNTGQLEPMYRCLASLINNLQVPPAPSSREVDAENLYIGLPCDAGKFCIKKFLNAHKNVPDGCRTGCGFTKDQSIGCSLRKKPVRRVRRSSLIKKKKGQSDECTATQDDLKPLEVSQVNQPPMRLSSGIFRSMAQASRTFSQPTGQMPLDQVPSASQVTGMMSRTITGNPDLLPGSFVPQKESGHEKIGQKLSSSYYINITPPPRISPVTFLQGFMGQVPSRPPKTLTMNDLNSPMVSRGSSTSRTIYSKVRVHIDQVTSHVKDNVNGETGETPIGQNGARSMSPGKSNVSFKASGKTKCSERDIQFFGIQEKPSQCS